jgi:hypothetical protein
MFNICASQKGKMKKRWEKIKNWVRKKGEKIKKLCEKKGDGKNKKFGKEKGEKKIQ